MTKTILALVLVLVGAVSALAETPAVHNMNTTQLVSTLGDKDNDWRVDAVYYTYGVAQGIGFGSWMAGTQFVCLPEGASPLQIATVFLKHANAHPEEWADEPEVLMVRAFIHAFPCPSKKVEPAAAK